MTSEILITLIVLSGVGGFLSGLLGIGGGVIFVPILSYVFLNTLESDQFLVQYTLANSFGIILFASAAATIKHIRDKNIAFKYILYIGIIGVPMSIAIAMFVLLSGDFSKFYFKILFLAIVLLAFVKMLFKDKVEATNSLSDIKPIKYGLVGGFTALVSGFTGVGGGIIMVPAFNKLYKVPIKKAAGLSSGAIFLFALVNVIQYALIGESGKVSLESFGFMKWDVIVYSIISVVVLAPIGVRVGQLLKPLYIRYMFAIVLLIVITKTVYSLIVM